MTSSTPSGWCDYAESRARFLSACEAAKAEVSTYSYADVSGLQGEELSCDVALFGRPDAKAILFVMSGTHGMEAPAPSAIQSSWIESGRGSRLPAGLAVAMIHAINPYGFSYRRRNDDGNVDPNRNFPLSENEPPPENPGYLELHDDLCPVAWRADTPQRLMSAVERFAQHTVRTVCSLSGEAMVGQFEP
jgi:polar amino acid transport system ATP-binding protein